MNTPKADWGHMTTIFARRVDGVARAMASEGITLSHAQARRVGEDACSWLCTRLGLQAEVTDLNVVFRPAQERGR